MNENEASEIHFENPFPFIGSELKRVSKEYGVDEAYGVQNAEQIRKLTLALFKEYEVNEEKCKKGMAKKPDIKRDLFYLDFMSLAERRELAQVQRNTNELRRLKYDIESSMVVETENPFKTLTLDDAINNSDRFINEYTLISDRLEKQLKRVRKANALPQKMLINLLEQYPALSRVIERPITEKDVEHFNYNSPDYQANSLLYDFLQYVRLPGVVIEDRDFEGHKVRIVRLPLEQDLLKAKIGMGAFAWREQDTIFICEDTSDETIQHEVSHILRDLPSLESPALHEYIMEYDKDSYQQNTSNLIARQVLLEVLLRSKEDMHIDSFDPDVFNNNYPQSFNWHVLSDILPAGKSGENFWSSIKVAREQVKKSLEIVRATRFVDNLSKVAPNIQSLIHTSKQLQPFSQRNHSEDVKNFYKQIVSNSGLFLISQLYITDPHSLSNFRSQYVDFYGGISLSYINFLETQKRIEGVLKKPDKDSIEHLLTLVSSFIEGKGDAFSGMLPDDTESEKKWINPGSDYTDTQHTILGYTNAPFIIPEFSDSKIPKIIVFALLEHVEELRKMYPEKKDSLDKLTRNLTKYSKTKAEFIRYFNRLPSGINNK